VPPVGWQRGEKPGAGADAESSDAKARGLREKLQEVRPWGGVNTHHRYCLHRGHRQLTVHAVAAPVIFDR
jgi:hypothetical protein